MGILLPQSEAWVKRLEYLEKWGYLTVGLSFLLIGMVNFAHAWYTFFISFREDVLRSIVLLTHELLFVLILMELFRTVINFLRSHTITLEPFFYIGIIAATRRILLGGTILGNIEELSAEVFNRYLWDIGLNVGIVVLLVIAVFVYHRRERPQGQAGH